MAYKKTKWVSGVTLLSAENFNKIEDGIEEAATTASEAGTKANKVSQEVETLKQNINNITTDIGDIKSILETLVEV
jgi:methyl-accepting chemotaxis protein